MNQIYFRPATSVPEKTIRSRQRLLRSNRMIDRALREAYRKYDRSKQTQSLLRRYLIANDALTNTLTSSRSLYRVKFVERRLSHVIRKTLKRRRFSIPDSRKNRHRPVCSAPRGMGYQPLAGRLAGPYIRAACPINSPAASI